MAKFFVWTAETKSINFVEGRRIGSSVIHGDTNEISSFWGETHEELCDKLKYSLEVRRYVLLDELKEIEESINEFDRRPERVHARSSAADSAVCFRDASAL